MFPMVVVYLMEWQNFANSVADNISLGLPLPLQKNACIRMFGIIIKVIYRKKVLVCFVVDADSNYRHETKQSYNVCL